MREMVHFLVIAIYEIYNALVLYFRRKRFILISALINYKRYWDPE